MGNSHSDDEDAVEDVQDLKDITHFSGSEIKAWHDRFYEEYPAGVITREEFMTMYEGLFPKGDSRRFADKIFKVCRMFFSSIPGNKRTLCGSSTYFVLY